MSTLVTPRAADAREDLMALIVLAISVVMIAVGLYEIYYGSNYITLEQGWSAFIAGTVLVTGGCLTAAVGLALRALADLRSVILRAGQPASTGMARPEPTMAASAFEPSAADPYGEADPRHGPLLDSLMPDLVPEPEETHADGPPHEIPSLFDSGPSREPEHDGRAAETATGSLDHGTPHWAAEPNHAPSPLHAEREAERVLGNHDALAHPDEETSLHELETAAADPHNVAMASSGRRADAPAAEQHPEPAPHSTKPATELVRADPPVIGRYEADGTSYVMYADGSIEAQSDAGIYRFASMAELRSFIET